MITTKQRILADLGAALVLGVLCFTGCPHGTGFDSPDPAGTASDLRQSGGVTAYPGDLADYVYGGNPGTAAGTWTTFAFNLNGTVIVQEVTPDSNNTDSETYVYDDLTGEVVISGYGTFDISDDAGSTMTSQGAPAVVYQNMRPSTALPSFATTPVDLTNTVFAAAGPRNPDWVTFVFRGYNLSPGKGEVIASFTGDNTTNVWVYTDKGGGVFNLDADPGQTDPGEFTLDTTNSTIVFTNFFGHAGSRTFNRRQ
ncbi:MAG: hypothetical protein LBD37_04735 [Treponema sp.]|jgi:hypothetical protein|nr:hypothetical protein [Treponema sp.]